MIQVKEIKVHGNRGIMIHKNCLICKEDFYVAFSGMSRMYCSQTCYGISKKGKPSWNKDRPWTKSERKKLSEAHMGIKMPPRTEEHRRNMAIARRGSKSHLWRGGVSEENRRIRMGVDFRLWREAIFERDNYTCQICEIRGGELHPDHIKPFAYFPELRFELSNGRTLCAQCHRKTETWGNKAKKYDN